MIKKTIASASPAAGTMQGWFHGLRLKGEIKGKGTEIKLLNFDPPAPRSLQATFIFVENEAVKKALEGLLKARKRISQFSLVVRKNPKSPKPDTEYRMASARVLKLGQRIEPRGIVQMAVVEVAVGFKGLGIIAGLMQNPGPLPWAPEITSMGPNKGWLHGVLPS